MKLQKLKLAEIEPYKNNPRKNDRGTEKEIQISGQQDRGEGNLGPYEIGSRTGRT